ncbi:MAG: hypothetical protein KC486_28890, partial [Myxococcales bacterium]|nr:hypothetical protein [Myxococcales bacterium]
TALAPGVAEITAEGAGAPASCTIAVAAPAAEGGCHAASPGDLRVFPECPTGGGSFGTWIVDDYGMPAFDYTYDQLSAAPWPNSEDIAPAFVKRRDHFTVTGNRRINLMAVDDGYAVLYTNDRAPTWLNRAHEGQRNLGGGFSYLRDASGGAPWASAYKWAPEGAEHRRVFGVGYYETQATHDGIAVRHRIIAPHGDAPLVIDEVELRNLGDEARTLDHVAYWDVNRHQLRIDWQRTGLFAAPSDGSRDALNDSFLQSVSWDAGAQALVATMTAKGGYTPPPKGAPDPVDGYPPPIFLAALVGEVDGVYGDQAAFFGDGTLAAPAALSGDAPAPDALLEAAGGLGQPAMLGLRSAVSLGPGESTTLRFAYGYVPEGESLALVDPYRDADLDVLGDSLDRWRDDLAYVYVDGMPLAHRETAWRSHALLAHSVYNGYYDARYTPQGSAYLYLHGADGAPRDQALFSLGLSYADPALARGNLLLIAGLQGADDGQITYSFTGYGVNEGATIHEQPSDLDLFFFTGLAEYLAATGDYGLLAESVDFYPRGSQPPPFAGDDTILGHVRAAFHNLTENVGLGPNGLVRIRDGDWSDGIVYEDLSPLAISNTIANGESVPNSQMALYALPHLADQIEAADPELAAAMRAYAEALVEPVRATFGSRWFARAWLRNSINQAYLKGNDLADDPYNANFIDLEAQPWGLLAADELLTPAQRDVLLDEIAARLDDDSPIGPRMRPDGMVWPAISQLMTWAYARHRPEAAWDALEEQLYATHAAIWPEQWIGVWGGPDGFNSAGTDGGTWASPVTPMTDFPVANMNPEAMWLLGLVRAAGVEPWARGLRIGLRLGSPGVVALDLRLLRLERSPGRVAGEYRPIVDGAIALAVELPEGARPSATVDGVAVAAAVVDGAAIVELELSAGAPRRFEVRW